MLKQPQPYRRDRAEATLLTTGHWAAHADGEGPEVLQQTKMEAAQQSRWSEDACSGVGLGALMPKSVQAQKAGLGRLPSEDGWLMLEKGWDLVGDMQRGLYCLQRAPPRLLWLQNAL